MKISKIIIDNIRCFEHLEIDLISKNQINQMTVFLGNNGVGKSTILRAIALCLCEESGAAGLLDELHGDWIRKESKQPARIKLEFEKTPNQTRRPFIETTINWSKYKEVEVTQIVEPKNRKFWDKLFVAAYGANRRTYGTVSYDEYTVTDAVYSLFNYAANMQNPELNVRRMQFETNIKQLFRKLEDILLLDKGSIKLRRTGLSIKGPWGSYLPMGTMADGYASVLAWIMDIYGWKLLFEKKLKGVNVRGIVLLDELEQHLHPVWQKEIIGRLTKQFKDVQFFFTTHSPVIAVNSFKTRKTDPNAKLFHIDWNGKGKSIISTVQEPLDELDYNQLLESEAFGHMTNINTEIERSLKNMSELASIDNPTKAQINSLNEFKNELSNRMFPKGKTLIQREVERDYLKALINENKKLTSFLLRKR